LDDEDRPPVTAERTRERGEDDAVVGFETRTRDLALQHRELMAQHEDLDILGTIASTAQHEQFEVRAGQHGRNGPPADPRSAPTRAAHANAKLQVTTPDGF